MVPTVRKRRRPPLWLALASVALWVATFGVAVGHVLKGR